MSKHRYRLVNSSAAALTLFLLAAAYSDSQAYADDPVVISFPARTMFLDTGADGEIATWWICYSYPSGVQTCVNTHQTDVVAAAEVGHAPEVSSAIPQSSITAER
jgi:hypothetical protein